MIGHFLMIIYFFIPKFPEGEERLRAVPISIGSVLAGGIIVDNHIF